MRRGYQGWLVRCLNVDKTTKPHCAARTVHKQAAGLRQLQLIGCVPCSTPQGTHAFLAWKQSICKCREATSMSKMMSRQLQYDQKKKCNSSFHAIIFRYVYTTPKCPRACMPYVSLEGVVIAGTKREIGCQYVHNCMFFPVRLWCMHRQAMGHPVACKESAFSRKFMTQVNVERKIVHVQWRRQQRELGRHSARGSIF